MVRRDGCPRLAESCRIGGGTRDVRLEEHRITGQLVTAQAGLRVDHALQQLLVGLHPGVDGRPLLLEPDQDQLPGHHLRQPDHREHDHQRGQLPAQGHHRGFHRAHLRIRLAAPGQPDRCFAQIP
jgi:hypothetical protein